MSVVLSPHICLSFTCRIWQTHNLLESLLDAGTRDAATSLRQPWLPDYKESTNLYLNHENKQQQMYIHLSYYLSCPRVICHVSTLCVDKHPAAFLNPHLTFELNDNTLVFVLPRNSLLKVSVMYLRHLHLLAFIMVAVDTRHIILVHFLDVSLFTFMPHVVLKADLLISIIYITPYSTLYKC